MKTKSELETKRREEEIVKCACGLPMRQKNWSDHWRSCRFGSSVPVTQEDVDNLIANETRILAGYTLIEILIVVCIIGLILSVVVGVICGRPLRGSKVNSQYHQQNYQQK